MKYPYDLVKKEFTRLLKNLNRVPKNTPFRYNTRYLSDLVIAIGTEDEYKQSKAIAIESLKHLFEKPEVVA